MQSASAPWVPSIDCLSVLVQTPLITAFKFSQSCPPSPSTLSLYHNLGVHLYVQSIMDSKCISKLARLQPLTASPDWLDNALQSRSITPSTFARSWPPSAFSYSPDHDLGVHLSVYSIATSKCNSKLTLSWPRSVSLCALDPHFRVHLEML